MIKDNNVLKKASPILVRLLVPLVLLAVIWTLADAEDALARLGNLNWGWVALAFVTVNLQTIGSAIRWQWVSKQLDAPFSLRWAIEEYYLAQLVNQTVPGGVVGDASRAVRSRHGAGLPRAAQAVVIERLAGQFMLFGVLAVGVVISLLLQGGIDWPFGLPALLFGVVAVVVVLGLAIWAARAKIKAIRSFGTAFRRALLARTELWKQLLIGLAIVGCNLLSFAFAARATGTVLSPEGIITLIPLILSAMLVPATIAGWGYREGAAAALFPLVGLSAAAGLAASLVFGLIVLAGSLPGVLVLLRRKKTGAPASSANP